MSLVELPADAPARALPELVERVGLVGPRPVLTATSADGRERTVLGSELPSLVARAGRFLTVHGVGAADRVAVHLDNAAAYEALILHLGAQWIGAVAVPVSTRLSRRELRGILEHAAPRVMVSRDTAALAADGTCGDVGLIDANPGLERLLAGHAAQRPHPVDEHTLADILYTSGTSGHPKGVEFTHGNCVACGMELQHAMDLRDDDTYQSAVPYFTSTGAHTNPLAALVARAHYVVEPAFDQHAAIARLRAHEATVYFAVPSMLTLILRDVDLTYLPDSLRTVVFGGATSTAAGIGALARAFPGRGLVNLYGQTEGGPGGTVLGPDDALTHAGSVGRRGNGPNTAFRVVRDDGTDADLDEVGEIALRSPAVMRGYHRDPDATRHALRDGWLHTTDLGRIDAEGYLWFVDRRSDLVVRGGFNISTSEVEAVLRSYAAIDDAAVVAIPHAVLDEDLAAFVVVADDADLDREDLRGYLRAELTDYKVPRTIVVVDDLPRNAMGKVLKSALREPRRAVEPAPTVTTTTTDEDR